MSEDVSLKSAHEEAFDDRETQKVSRCDEDPETCSHSSQMCKRFGERATFCAFSSA